MPTRLLPGFFGCRPEEASESGRAYPPNSVLVIGTVPAPEGGCFLHFLLCYADGGVYFTCEHYPAVNADGSVSEALPKLH